ncbi:hypothetical protein V8F06_004818 [Rhypophila decipiens]
MAVALAMSRHHVPISWGLLIGTPAMLVLMVRLFSWGVGLPSDWCPGTRGSSHVVSGVHYQQRKGPFDVVGINQNGRSHDDCELSMRSIGASL